MFKVGDIVIFKEKGTNKDFLGWTATIVETTIHGESTIKMSKEFFKQYPQYRMFRDTFTLDNERFQLVYRPPEEE